MIWLFQRNERRARLEVLYLGSDSYEVRFTDERGVDHVEHWSNASDVANRQLGVLHTLQAQGWTQTGGWKI